MIEVSQHAYTRARERLSWNRSAIERMAERAFIDGAAPEVTKGLLKLYLNEKKARYLYSDVRIYGEYMYFYARTCPGYVLVTVYMVPNDLKGLIPRGKDE